MDSLYGYSDDDCRVLGLLGLGDYLGYVRLLDTTAGFPLDLKVPYIYLNYLT